MWISTAWWKWFILSEFISISLSSDIKVFELIADVDSGNGQLFGQMDGAEFQFKRKFEGRSGSRKNESKFDGDEFFADCL